MKAQTQMSFLYVEDELFAQIVHKEIARRLGYALDIVDTGQKALDLIEKNKYDLIFIDQGLPDMVGVELANKLKNIYKIETPLVALTAFGTADKQQECLDSGFSFFLEKPLLQSHCQELLNSLCARTAEMQRSVA